MLADPKLKMVTLGLNESYLHDPENNALISNYEDPVIIQRKKCLDAP